MLFANIPSYNWEKIEKKSKSLSKYGCSVSLVEVSTYKEQEVITINLDIPNELEHGKWSFLGFKKVCGDGVLYFGDVPQEYHNTSMYCEHCSSNRSRKSVIIIEDLESGTVKQVGKTCVKKYLGSGFEMLANLLLTIDDIIPDESDHEYYGYSIFSKYVDLRKYLYYCLKDIKARGYTKRDYYNRDVEPTSNKALDLYDDNKNAIVDLTEVDKAIAVYKEFASSKNDDFSHNVVTLLSTPYIERRYINMVAFVPTFLLNKRKFEAEKKAKEEQKAKFNSSLSNEYIGNVGDKVSTTVRLIHYRYYETHFTYKGETNCIYTFMDTNGSLIQWKTQKDITDDLDKAIEDKTLFNIKGTVKECKEFRERFYTVLTRCKVTK